MLTQRLRELERDGIVNRTFRGAVPPRVAYQRTELGLSLIPILRALCGWADTVSPEVAEPNRTYDRRQLAR